MIAKQQGKEWHPLQNGYQLQERMHDVVGSESAPASPAPPPPRRVPPPSTPMMTKIFLWTSTNPMMMHCWVRCLVTAPPPDDVTSYPMGPRSLLPCSLPSPVRSLPSCFDMTLMQCCVPFAVLGGAFNSSASVPSLSMLACQLSFFPSRRVFGAPWCQPNGD